VKFLADMGLARHTVEALRQQGHDAVHLREQGLQRLDDREIIAKAVHEGRVILTHDLDFGRLVATGGSQLPSVITFRLRNMRPEQVERHLFQVIPRFVARLEAGALISVSDRSIRVRVLPVRGRPD
jgi:predicted nuclease of predicted toxin-antitoxin system